MIVHIIGDEKFAPDLIQLINDRFDQEEHLFLVQAYSQTRTYVRKDCAENVILLYKNIRSTAHLAKWIKKGNKIIFHGLFSRVAMFLVMVTGASKKTYSCLWGGDLYVHDKEGKFQHTIKKHILTHCKGIAMELEYDYYLAKEWYGATCRYFPCLLYMSNVVREKHEYKSKPEQTTTTILIGNSATASNRHSEILKNLQKYADRDIKLIIPLSYGNDKYANEIQTLANSLFQGKVVALREFKPIDEYLKILDGVDVAVFAHKRQQGLGNAISLISMGKKVYLPRDGTMYKSFKKLGISVFETEELRETVLEKINKEQVQDNIDKMYSKFSKEQLIKDWEIIFDD